MSNKSIRNWIGVGLVVGAIALGLAAVQSSGIVQAGSLAQGSGTPTPNAPFKGERGFGARGGMVFINATASVTGLSTQEIMTDLQNGQSFAQIAQSKGKTADDVIKAARTQLQDQLKQAVTNGQLTQAKVDAQLSRFDQTASQVVNNTFSFKPGFAPGFGSKGGPGFTNGFGYHDGGSLINATASVTGLTLEEIMTDLQNSQSLAQIAQSKGKTADDVIKAARTQLQDQLKQAVTNNRLTQAQSDALLANFDQNAAQLVNDAALGSGRGFGGGMGRGFGPGFGPGFGFQGGFGFHDSGSLISATASATGLSMQEVMTDLRNGQSLAQIAQNKGKTADDVIKAARAQLQDQLKQLVTKGTITQAQSDTLLSNFDQNASKMMNATTLGQQRGLGGRMPGGATPPRTRFTPNLNAPSA